MMHDLLQEIRRAERMLHHSELLRRHLRGTRTTWTPGDALIASCRQREREIIQERMVQSAIALDRQQTGKNAALRQHDLKRQWYQFAVDQAREEWEQGSPLRQDQMAVKLMKDAPAEISRQSLVKKLTALLREMDRPHLIRGIEK